MIFLSLIEMIFYALIVVGRFNGKITFGEFMVASLVFASTNEIRARIKD